MRNNIMINNIGAMGPVVKTRKMWVLGGVQTAVPSCEFNSR